MSDTKNKPDPVDPASVPKAVINRLSLYQRELQHLVRDGKETTSSSQLGRLLGFVEPPLGFYVFLVCAVAAYLLLVEIVKRQLYRRLDARSPAKASAHAHRRRAPGKAA